jgi:hypothetical protein
MNMSDNTYTKDELTNAKLYSFMLENEQRDLLQKEAQARQISVSQLIREAIELWFRVNT